MRNGLNSVHLMGNLGADPELRQTVAGPVLKLRLATNERWLDKEKQQKEKTEWHSITVFGARATGLATFLRKGHAVFVEGRLETNSYEKEGQKHYRTAIIATDLIVIGSPRGHDGPSRQDPMTAPTTNGFSKPAPAADPTDLIDIPF